MDIPLVIGIPHTGTIRTETFISLLPIIRSYPAQFQFVLAEGCYVHKNRNEIVAKAQSLHAKHLLFVDTDIVFPPDALLKLMQLKKPIAAAPYRYRRASGGTTIKMADSKGKLVEGSYSKTDKPFKVYAAATGFMLIDMEVFNTMREPYFFFSYIYGELEGEDMYFCRKATEAGFEIWVDPSIEIKHMGAYAY